MSIIKRKEQMKINIKLVGFIAWVSYVAGSMISHLGEDNPAYKTDWKLVLIGIILPIGLFYWGYSTGKDNE